MIKAVKLKDVVNRENLGCKCTVMFETVVGETEEGAPEFGQIEAGMHYYERGEGEEAILMLHGPGQSLYTYRNNFEFLAKEGYRVLVPDLLGCGYSDCPDMDYAIEDMSLSIQSFLANLGVMKVHVVAFGQSCAYAADLAYNNPDLVKSLVFINPGAFSRTGYPKAKAIAGIMGNMAVNNFTKHSFAEDCYEMSFFDKTLITEKMVHELARPFENPDLKLCLRNMTVNYNDDEIIEKLMNFDKPVLLVKSEDDVISNKDDYKAYLHSSQMGYTVNFRNCGYLPHEEKHATFNSSLLEFLNY